jgi:signal transduction histidine kinase
VRLGTEDGEILAEVSDNGRGFDMASVRAGVGLSAMRERIEGVGGTLAIYGRPGEGTRVVVSIPLGHGTLAPRGL